MTAEDRLTDEKLKEMEKHLREIYDRADKEVGQAWTEYMEKANADVSRLTEAYIKAKESGDKDAIREAGKALAGAKQERTIYNKHYQQLTRDLAENISHVNETAVAYINNQLPEIYSLNYNSVAKRVNKELGGMVGGTSFDLVDQNTVKRLATRKENLLPLKEVNGKKDIRWNVAKINSEVTQGILQGEAMPKIAERLSNVMGMDKVSAIRNARTTVTSAQNKGRMDMMRHARSKGVIVQKGWSSALDDRTRESHLELDGEFVDEDEPFSNGLMYPGDPNGAPEEVYNCRCSLIYKVVGFGEPQEEEDDPWMGFEEEGTEQQEPNQLASEINNVLDESFADAPQSYRDAIRASVDDMSDSMKEIVGRTINGANIEYNEGAGTCTKLNGSDRIVMYRGDKSEQEFVQTFWHEYGHLADKSPNGGFSEVVEWTNKRGQSGTYTIDGIQGIINNGEKYSHAGAKDINLFLERSGLSDKYYAEVSEWGTIVMRTSDGSYVNPLNMSFETSKELSQSLVDYVHKSSGLTDAWNYLESQGYPSAPKWDDYYEAYVTPKRNLVRNRERYKGAAEAYQRANEAAYEARELFEQTHDMKALYAMQNKLIADAELRESIIGFATDTFDECASGAFTSAASVGGHTAQYYMQGGHGEGVANVFSALATEDKTMNDALKDLCPNVYELIKGVIKP